MKEEWVSFCSWPEIRMDTLRLALSQGTLNRGPFSKPYAKDWAMKNFPQTGADRLDSKHESAPIPKSLSWQSQLLLLAEDLKKLGIPNAH